MKIQDVCTQLKLTKKAIYYYEKQGLLHVSKDKNGYRDFSKEDIERLHEISIYRKWDIGMNDIKVLLDMSIEKKKVYLQKLCKFKEKELEIKKECLDSMKHFIFDNQNFQCINENLDCVSLLQAIQENIPGIYGYFFSSHFQPYLSVTIETDKQKEAYQKVLSFWEYADIKLPLFIHLLYWYEKSHIQQVQDEWIRIENTKYDLLEDENAYEKMKKLCERHITLSKKWWYRIINYPQRQLKVRLRDNGYYDILIPAMRDLSPAYDQYYQKWTSLNTQVCQELGIYYDSKFRIQQKSESMLK